MISHCPYCELELGKGIFYFEDPPSEVSLQYYDCPQCPHKFGICFNQKIFHMITAYADDFRVMAWEDHSTIYNRGSKLVLSINKSYTEWSWHNLKELEQEVKTVLAFS